MGGEFIVEFDGESRQSTAYEAGSLNHMLEAGLEKESLGKKDLAPLGADGLLKGEHEVHTNSVPTSGVDNTQENLKIIIDKNLDVASAKLAEKKVEREKRKSMSAKKPPKPPRPPRGLSLDAADQKLIREVAELAMIKRAKIERIKAWKKMKAAKASSSSSSGNFIALVFTVVFCFVLLFQGMSYSNPSTNFHGSSISTGASENLGPVKDIWNQSVSNSTIAGSGFISPVDSSGPDPSLEVKTYTQRKSM